MISLATVYHVLVATVPLYAAMILAYLSIKWWKLFTPDQCTGINKFVAKFSVPLLSFHVISTNNPYKMNLKLLVADSLQKILALFVFAVLSKACFRGSLDWLITGFSLSTLPNTLIIGIPLLKGLYGDEAAKLLGQIVVLQSLIWYTLLLILFEFRAAKAIAANPTDRELESSEGVRPRPEEDEVKSLSIRNIRSLLILWMAGKKLMINPNTYASLAGFVWALISFRWRIELPLIISNCISILSDGGLGMAMFSLGLFTASQSSIIACGIRMMILSMGLRFIIGPALIAITSYAIGMRAKLLKVAIVQAALPQGIVTFVFAKEYGVHPDILSTGVIVGMIIAVPIALAYYFILDPN
ncbi:probable auxin efflux carrier component 8 [Phoenix dactylifera]|uniref:Auxin efflux carrier component n=1 Tax=Phoenix dactylifera TaxID=42345 RepID=A0A8B8ZVH0_PHODC|nr:probable auxin efflux carrier component 8 [Phoenix dactylifera]XP_038978290.1 probable auxin efflux carrier component 8 [Phoenix dactylifera]